MTANRLTALRALENAVGYGTADEGYCARVWPSESAGGHCTWHNAYRAYLGSIDAAKALHDAVLPGWDLASLMDTTDCQATVRDLNTHAAWIASYDKTPARAWLLAVIRALIWQEENRHD